MSKIKSALVEAVLPIVKAVGKAEMELALSGIKEHNSTEIYQTALQGLHSNFLLLKEAAQKTKSKVDDGIIDLILEAVAENAAADGIPIS
jgi:hypothetical protein